VLGDSVRGAVELCVAALRPRLAEDWSAPVPDLEFTVASVIAHATVAPLWYALDLWAGSTDSAGFTLSVEPDTSPDALVAGLTQAGMVCAASIDAAPPELRGFHPFGSPDRTGFAAMACAELLIHTDDALRGLGTRLTAPPALAGAVLTRLFPAHEPGDDPWQTLLRAHDRPSTLGPPATTGWRWHPAPMP
jgi:Mycothiol maleylpyruvate isomerase N-terminal domain